MQENVPQVEEFKEFDHEFNVQHCVTRCLTSTTMADYIIAVDNLEMVLIPETNDEINKKIEADYLEAKKDYGAANIDNPQIQYMLAKKKFRLLYAFRKKKSALPVVLAIGRPKCHNCGELILWNSKDRKAARKEKEGV